MLEENRYSSILKLNNVSLGYDKIIYQNISAYANPGEMIAIIGANGKGKSTLLKTICKIIKRHTGEILILDKAIESISSSIFPTLISYVPSQNPRPKNLSLFDMMATSLYNKTNWLGKITADQKSIIIDTLTKVGLSQYINRDCTTLSDGEFQRATIARSLIQDSKIITLDEPTAFLDIANKIIITKLLKEISITHNKTIIFSTHDIAQAIKLCDKIWLMGYDHFYDDTPSSLIEKGAFDKLFKDSNLKFDKEILNYI